ncbi:MAG: YceI family protein [Rhodothermales bacterium]|nr:YceI family protein [Rhodothermales bacterium]
MRYLSLTLVLAFLAMPVSGQAFMTDSGTAEFESSVPLHSFVGTSEVLVGRIALPDSTVDFYLDLETLDTGNGKRDKDMKKTLDTDEHPFAEFFGKLVSPFDPDGGQQEARVVGSFSLHGVTREVEVSGTLEPTANGLQLNAAWELSLEDYDIVPPKLLIIKVDPIQQVRISALLTPESGT